MNGRAGVATVMGNCEESLAAAGADCGCGFATGSACDVLSRQWFAYAAAHLDGFLALDVSGQVFGVETARRGFRRRRGLGVCLALCLGRIVEFRLLHPLDVRVEVPDLARHQVLVHQRLELPDFAVSAPGQEPPLLAGRQDLELGSLGLDRAHLAIFIRSLDAPDRSLGFLEVVVIGPEASDEEDL